MLVFIKENMKEFIGFWANADIWLKGTKNVWEQDFSQRSRVWIFKNPEFEKSKRNLTVQGNIFKNRPKESFIKNSYAIRRRPRLS